MTLSIRCRTVYFLLQILFWHTEMQSSVQFTRIYSFDMLRSSNEAICAF
uniref:Uncharacterized protein n=1 Tax=Arundo donax TaxID=35708 RepID=A0A0A9A3P3_ARUDO